MNAPLPPAFPLKYLAGYAPEVQAQVRQLIAEQRLADMLAKRYADKHEVRSDKALFEYTLDLKNRYMRNAGPLSMAMYDNKLKPVQHALGTHTTVSRVQGAKLKTKREIRVATVFREAPAAFLKMIVVHELAHMKERDHDKAFYQLCEHMEPTYHQLEFDLRLYLTQLDLNAG
ncbi:M48 family metallopeptidase [soil metagenome]